MFVGCLFFFQFFFFVNMLIPVKKDLNACIAGKTTRCVGMTRRKQIVKDLVHTNKTNNISVLFKVTTETVP